MEALHWLAGHESLMSAMEITRTKIMEESAKLLSQSIWPRWEKTWKNIKDGDTLAGVIARQTASHVAEHLGLPPNYHHPEEFYLVPPLSMDRLDTGDLIAIAEKVTEKAGEKATEKIIENVHVVVTSRCNLAHDPTLPYTSDAGRARSAIAEV